MSVNIRKAQLNEGDTADDYVKTEANAYSFKGDETQLNDYSGSNNGAQIHSGGALSFTTNDEVTLPYEIEGTFTVCGYVNFESKVGTNPFISSQETANDDGMSMGLSNDAFFVKVRTAFATTVETYDGQDLHIACSWNGSTVKGYINGSEVLSFAYSGSIPATLTKIGRAPFVSVFAEMEARGCQIYNTALTSTQVLYNYNNPQTPITDGLVAWYDFNELNGLTLFDRSGNGYNGAINGATWVSGVKEGYQPALAGFNNYQVFDGTDDEAVTAFSPSDTDFSFYAHFIIDESNADNTGILEQDNTINRRWGIDYANSGRIRLIIFGTSNTSFPLPRYATGTEIKVLGRYNGTNLEVNTSAVPTKTSTALAAPINSATQNITIGSRDGAQFAKGLIIDAAYFDESISDSDAEDLVNGVKQVNEISGAVSWWKNLDGFTDSISSNDATVNGSPVTARIAGAEYNSTTDVFSNTIQNAYIANALNFSGGFSGLFVDAGSSVDTSGAFSYAGWVYVNDIDTIQIFAANRTSGDGLRFSIRENGSNFDLSILNETLGVPAELRSSAQSYGSWVFYCFTRAATNEANIFVGNKTTTPSNQSDTVNFDLGAPAAGSENYTIGAEPSGATVPLDGYLLQQIGYTEDLSSANTDTSKIEQIWAATKGLIPS